MSLTKKYQWHKVGDRLADIGFNANGMAEVTVDNKKVCIALYNKVLMACSQKCPHAGGVMAHGYIDVLGNIVCPLHQYKFNLQNGKNVSGEGYYLKTWPVELREDGIYVASDKKSFF